jgi:hypothetical protein
VKSSLRWRLLVVLSAALAVIGLVVASPASGANPNGRSPERDLSNAAEGRFEALEAADQYAEARTSPAELVDAGAFSGAYADYKNLAVTPGTWTQKTTVPYDSDAHNYRDPVWSNSGGGAQHVAGRMTALAADGSTLYAGAADGGVWKKMGSGPWQPLTDDSPTLSIGALTVDPSHGLWVGTGEANTNSDSYAGVGVLFSSDGGANFARVGGDELNNHTLGSSTTTVSSSPQRVKGCSGTRPRPGPVRGRPYWPRVSGCLRPAHRRAASRVPPSSATSR